jgi:UDP-N-acetylglucosamine--N-acetylmuramyl-(pentapeptide) pyrophosphoryl-undecaprenol N-acetylglucosamine transferase
MRILFTGGGSGGHIFPIIAIARDLRRLYSKNDLEFYYLGPKEELSHILLSQEDFKIKNIFGGKIRRYFSFENFIDILFKIPFGVLQSFFLILIINPQIVFSKGGSGSVAVAFCAKILGIPLFIHESDIVPGLSNRTSFKWAKKTFVSFPKTEYFEPEKTILTGNPIRKELLEGDKEKAREMFSLTYEKPIILFFGGSQGAQAINDFVLNTMNDLLKDFEVIHVTGRENFKQIEAEAQIVADKMLVKYYHPIGFLDEEHTKHAYKAVDFIVSRSGAGSIFEIAAIGKPSILVPLPSAAADHQAKNAYAYAATGAAIVIEQDNLTKNFFMERLQYVFLHPELAEKMQNEALRFSKPLAGKAIAREILEYLMLQ